MSLASAASITPIRTPINQVAGGRVMRSFRIAGKTVMPGTNLSHEELSRMPTNNRNSLVDKGFIEIFPKAALEAFTASRGGSASELSERVVVSLGFGRFDVVEGRKLNVTALSREQAHELAGLPLAKAKKSA